MYAFKKDRQVFIYTSLKDCKEIRDISVKLKALGFQEMNCIWRFQHTSTEVVDYIVDRLNRLGVYWVDEEVVTFLQKVQEETESYTNSDSYVDKHDCQESSFGDKLKPLIANRKCRAHSGR